MTALEIAQSLVAALQQHRDDPNDETHDRVLALTTDLEHAVWSEGPWY